MRRLLALFALLIASSAGATTFTATQSGDWNTNTTWGTASGSTCGTNIPCMTSGSLGGDQVVIPSTYVVSCTGASEVCSAGTSPANHTTLAIHVTGTGGIHVGGTATLIYAGEVQFGNGASVFTVDAGGTIQHDSSWAAAPTTAAYVWGMSDSNNNGPSFSLNGTSGSHIIWQGDSYYSSLKDSSTCTTVNTCRSGLVGANMAYTDVGWGTLSYVDFLNVGVIGSGDLSYSLNVGAKSTAITGGSLTNSATGSIMSSAGVGNVTVNGWSNLSCAISSIGYGCFQLNNSAAFTGTRTIKNSIFDYVVGASGTTKGGWTWTNDLFWASLTNANPGISWGFASAIDASTYNQILFFNSTISDNGGASVLTPSQSFTNSIVWVERTPGNVHSHPFISNWAYSLKSGTMSPSTNNVYGSMLMLTGTSGTTNDPVYVVQAGGNPTVATTMNWGGNVYLCGANGQSSTSGLLFLDNGNVSNISLTLANNTTCSGQYGLTSTEQNPYGNIGAEAITIASGTVTTVNSNLFFRNDTTGGPIAETCDSTNAGYVTTPWMTILTHNALVGTNTAATPICANTVGWNASGPTGDITIENRPPVLVEPNRSLPLFDTEYLIPAGLLTLGSYTGVAPWANSTSYTVGQYVSDSQSGVWGGKTTYWRCIQAHTSATATNRPVTGICSSACGGGTANYSGHVAYWEPAFMPFLRSAVLTGTTYTDGAINASGVGIIGLLNAWLRQGMTSMEPTLWNGCLSGVECGAIQLTATQHIPPPAGVN